MAKKSKKKFIGSKVSRGTNNPVLTPSGGKSQQAALETAIVSSSDAIIAQLKEVENQETLILAAMDKLSVTDSITTAIKSLQTAIEDKMTAMIAVMYGLPNASVGMKSSAYLSKLNKIDPKFTSDSGIYNILQSINESIKTIAVTGEATSGQKNGSNAQRVTISGDVKLITGEGKEIDTKILNELRDILCGNKKNTNNSGNIGILGSIININGIKEINKSLDKKLLTEFSQKIEALKTALDKISEINLDTNDNQQKKLRNVAILITVCTGVLVLGVSAGKYIAKNWQSVIVFTTSLSTFMLLTIGAITLGSKGLDIAADTVKHFTVLVVACAYTMLLGGFIMTKYPQVVLGGILFGVTLGIFIFTVVNAFKFASRGSFGKIKDSVKDLGIIVSGSAAVMVIGGLFMLIPGMPAAALGFTLILAGFIWAITFAYKKAAKGITKAFEYAGEFGKLIKISAAVLIVGGGLLIMFPMLIAGIPLFTVMLMAFIGSVTWAYSHFAKDAADAIGAARNFGILIAISAATMMLGGYIIYKNPWVALGILGFGILLAGFIGGVTWLYCHFAKDAADAIGAARNFAILVGISAAVLLLGGYIISQNLMIGIGVLIFGVLLAAFVGGLAYIYKHAGENLKENISIAKDFGILVGISAAILLAGGAIMMIDGMKTNAVMFAVTSIAFVAGMAWVYRLINNMFKGSSPKTVKEKILIFGMYTGMMGAILLIGAGVMSMSGIIVSAFAFIGLSIAFVAGMAWVAGMVKNMMKGKNTKAAMLEFVIFTGLVSAILLIGAGVMSISGIIVSAFAFIGLSIAFVAGMAWVASMVKAVMKGKNTKAAMLEFIVFTGLVSAILLIGAGFMMIDGMAEAALKFIGVSALYIIAMGAMCWVLSKIGKKNIMTGIFAMAGLMVILFLMGGLMTYISEVSTKIDFWGALKVLGVMAIAMVAVGGLCYILGTLVTNPEIGLILAAGAGALIAIIGIVMLAVDMVKGIAAANDALADMKELDYSKVVKSIGGFAGVVGYTTSRLGSPLLAGRMTAARYNVWLMSSCVADIADTVKKISNLTVPVFDETGKQTGVRKLEESDFQEAADNIKTIITVLGGAVMETYEKNPEMFSVGASLKELLFADTAFSRVCKSCMTMGKMISKIAESVKQYADLRIDVYDPMGAKVIGSRPLKDTDFQQAAENVRTIITVIGSEIIETYNKNPEMFSAGTIGDLFRMETPFARVVRSCTTMGKMISKIAESVKQYADLRIDVYDPMGAKVIGSRPLKEKDFKAAAANVAEIIQTLGGAVMATYNNDTSGMFTWHLFGRDNKFVRVVKSVTQMNTMISGISKAVKDYANLRVDVYNEQGDKVIGSRAMSNTDFIDAAINIRKIISFLGGAILGVYNDPRNKEMFTDPQNWRNDADRTAFGIVTKALAGVGKLISDGATAIKDVVNLNIDMSDAGKKLIQDKAKFAVGVLAEAIVNVAVDDKGEPKKAFADESWFHTNAEKTPVGMVKAALTGSSALIKEGIALVGDVAKLPDYDEASIKAKVTLAVGALANDIVKLAEEHADVFEDPGWFSNDANNSAVGKVKTVLAGTTKLIKEGVDLVGQIIQMKFNPKTIQDRVDKVVGAVPNAILNATVHSKDSKKNAWWNDDPNGKITNIKTAYTSMTELFTAINKEYGIFLKNGLNNVDVNAISLNIEDMLTTVPRAFKRASYNIATSVDAVTAMADNSNKYERAVEAVINIYKNVWKMMSVFGGESDAISAAGEGLGKMFVHMSHTLAIVAASKMQDNAAMFAESMAIYRNGVDSLTAAFNAAPDDTAKYSNMQQAIHGVNIEISNIPSLEKFTEETKLITSYVKAVNSINVSKVDRLANLANALTVMSTKLGSLEGLTDVLANKVSTVLANLTARLDTSAKVINKAEKIQQDRHKKISEAMAALKSLMDKPLNVNVVHKPDPDTEQMPQGSAANDTTGQQHPQAQSSSANLAASKRYIQGIARDEAKSVYNAMEVQKNSRLGGWQGRR